MIPISLTLKGIYSYQEKEQTIQFNHLTDAGIFGVFGSVGSGKSTILEAISYALYGDTERLNRRENRAYNMLNLKSSNLLIDFVFQAGNEHEEYRFIVKGRRNSKRFADVKSFSREAFKKKADEWQPILVDSAEEIIGLNYLNFRRTVIIPQGKFQEFLQLGDADRTKMMKELFHLERFDLQYKVGAMENENNAKLSNIDGQLIQLLGVSEEQIVEIGLRIKEKEQAFKQNKKRLEHLQKQNEAFEKVQDLFKQISISEKQYNVLSTEKQKYKLFENELNKYNYCIQNFSGKISDSVRLKLNNKSLKEEIEASNINLKSLKQQISADQEELKLLKPQFDKREQLKTQAEDLGRILEIKDLIDEVKVLMDRIEKGETTLKETVLKGESLSAKKQETQNKIKQLKSNIPDLAILSDIKLWYTNYHHLENEAASLQKEKSGTQKKLLALETELIALAKNMFPELKNFTIKNIIAEIEQTNIEKRGQISQVEDDLKHFLIKEKLSAYANSLQNGEACPVCGSTSHPDKLKESDISVEVARLNTAKGKLNKELDELRGFEKKMDNLSLKSSSLKENLVDLQQKEQENKQKREANLASYPAKEKMGERELEEQYQLANSLQKELKIAEKEYNLIEKSLEQELINKENFLALLNQLKNELIAKNTQKETLGRQIKQGDIKQGLGLERSVIKKQISKLLKQYDELGSQFEQCTQRLNSTLGKSAKLEGIILSKSHELNSNTKEFEKTNKELQDKIQGSDFKSVEYVKEVLEKRFDVLKASKEISTFKQKLYSAKEQLDKLKTQAEGKKYDAENHQKNREETSKLKVLLEEAGKELGSLENDVETLKIDLQKKKILEKEQNDLKSRGGNLSVLKSMFKGSGFVNYVSSVYLQNLINAANERFFKLTGQKLQLELTEDNNFEIRDFLNGGKTRSVKTLSGGQTFQAALSLALALADNIQSLGHAGNNFFFLDEGFGSLDKESLSVVFSTLKTLRKENRTVGIISHVEDLRHEVETYLKIENKPELGSLISKSWA